MEPVVSPATPRSPLFPDTLESVTALARFEFESGGSNEGTKVMMVEWQDDDTTRSNGGSWDISWHGKRTVFDAHDTSSDDIRRVYFLIPPGQTVPPQVVLAYHPPRKGIEVVEPLRKTVNALPAIFPPELGATAKDSGRKGVLHTIWAKKRLQNLDKEIKREEALNTEGIGLQMALTEKEWIENNFGLHKPPSLDMSSISQTTPSPRSPGIQSPKSPSGRRLTEKLKGLTLGTSAKDLAGQSVNTPIRDTHPLSPDGSDIAYSSFNSFHPSNPTPISAVGRKVVGQAPPEQIRRMQAASFMTPLSSTIRKDTEDDLFAVALSPRPPDDPKSPYSLSTNELEAGAFARIKGSRSPTSPSGRS